MQDPSQMTRYGRSLANSVMYPMVSSPSREDVSTPDLSTVSPPGSTTAPKAATSDLVLRGGMVASDGRGVFQTLAPIRMSPRKVSKKAEAYQRRRCREHLLRLQEEVSLVSHRPFSSETKLAAMFVNILDSSSDQHQHIFTLGNWVLSIPARIGSSPVVTMAAEFFVHSFEVHRDRNHSNHMLALRTKSTALKELQLSVLASQQRPTYDLMIATKLHYAAEVLDQNVSCAHWLISTGSAWSREHALCNTHTRPDRPFETGTTHRRR